VADAADLAMGEQQRDVDPPVARPCHTLVTWYVGSWGEETVEECDKRDEMMR
jgi:hypothetical protein